MHELLQILAPEAKRLILFHIIREGRCWVSARGERVELEAGDIAVLPHANRHLFLARSPIRYLAEWRIQISTDLLTSTRMKISAVAERVGYELEEAFSRAFRRQLGTSSSRWRENASPPRQRSLSGR